MRLMREGRRRSSLISGLASRRHHSLAAAAAVIVVAVSIVIQDYQSSCSISVGGVVVDGNKKSDLSATRRQTNDEKSSIDKFNTKTCGISDPNFGEHEFINMAREGQFPWLVSFQIKILSNTSAREQISSANKSVNLLSQNGRQMEDLHFCSGSFVSDKWILSAAHCFTGGTVANYFDNDKLIVVAGSHKVSSRSRLNTNLTIERIYHHSHFRDKQMPIGFDLALVELTDRVEFAQKRLDKNEFGEQTGPFMNSICLPRRGKAYKFNETARLAGWGLSNSHDVTSMPSKLLTTDILLTNQTECVQQYVRILKSEKPLEQKEKYDDFICANYKNSRDACQSDSGSPLMQYANRKAVAVGIVSYGVGCASKGVPGIYTRTSAYIVWIRDVITNGKSAKVAFKVLERKQGEK